jgi:hypothetical protein
MLHRFLMSSLFFKCKLKFYQRYIANLIGDACNSQIPRANLHAKLNLSMQGIEAIEVPIFETIVG